VNEKFFRDQYIEGRIQAAYKNSSKSIQYIRKHFEQRFASGEMLVAESIFYVSDENYDFTTKGLIVKSFPPNFFKEQDNVNVKVNSAMYNTEAFTLLNDSNVLYWKPGKLDAGFDLEKGDLIEIEVFRKI
jgi:CRISPR/Cas system CSM-associated protein Csm4 (group 5 of RAMP superfamily)